MDLCWAVLELNSPIDPDGVIKNRQSVISSKLGTYYNTQLPNLDSVKQFIYNLTFATIVNN